VEIKHIQIVDSYYFWVKGRTYGSWKRKYMVNEDDIKV